MNKQNRFLPTTKDEMKQRGWDELDVVLITGDAYIDSPFMGIAVVGRILEDIGLRVGIIGQPDINSDVDIKRLGEPKLFWGVSGGSIDSMVSNYTATKKFRNDDDYTPGGKNNKRPDRATPDFVAFLIKKVRIPIIKALRLFLSHFWVTHVIIVHVCKKKNKLKWLNKCPNFRKN